ncbi:hypothetical protein Afil01_23130 [Actinorhabdospora filicis]|uniref:Uncharacterized protein n=1 Tax=Actinorhabdospora filicis TaxID=1785913 RepID=A0A9W6SKP9_9ACTN|nr:hypothetical protein [Actinorhabdospora filicis]GLZ77506.1 hypothetical protein Afil01_23130 [Actinorhabdospora filicis]
MRKFVHRAVFTVSERLKLGVSAAYLAAGSLIGVEALVLVLTYTSMWPVSIPIVIGGLAAVHYIRKRVRRMRGRRDDD